MMKVAVISTFAVDKLVDENIEVRSGGPALFIISMLNKFGIPYTLFTTNAIVRINMRNGVEKGRVDYVGSISATVDDTDIVLISTLLDEFKLKAVGKFCCVDLQGYVRDGSDFGKKKCFDSKELETFDVVKVTKRELTYISKSRTKKIKLLLVTNGAKGFEVITRDKKYRFNVDEVKSINTVGAGDTFFTAFCIKYYQTRDIIQSAEFAKEITTNFLKEKGGDNFE